MIQDKNILSINIESEMRQAYLDYAMSVIVGRALPDARDGLKPVHRRVLYAMHELNNDWNKPYKKSARVVGDVIGKYHPHGDSAVYDSIVRMAQPFSLRYTLVDGQGNFGSIDGDSAAAMRYTEIRMQKITHEIISDIDKDTVNFSPNYDGTETIPEVMPTRVPNLLINGSAGIAVGMATNIPPHNLNNIINACLHVIDNEDITIDELLEFVPGPDFPTGAIINGRSGIVKAYKTGKGKVVIRAKTRIETHEKNEVIIVDELPYQINKARLIEKIGFLVKEGKLEGISDIRDESDKEGLRISIEVKRNDIAEVVLNNLYAQTGLQVAFGINMVALVDGQPKLLNLKELLLYFIQHRREVVIRRSVFLLNKAKERGHILEGLVTAIVNIDEIIALIKSSQTPAIAKEKLMKKGWAITDMSEIVILVQQQACQIKLDEIYGVKKDEYWLSSIQAQAILDLRLHRLTGLEYERLQKEYQEKIAEINSYLGVIQDPDELIKVIREELIEILDKYGDERKTEIMEAEFDLTEEDLITPEDRVVTLSQEGYAKAQPLSDYQAQRRGGKGKVATKLKEEDWVEQLIIANTHDTLLCFSNNGKVYWLKTFQIPVGSRISKGRPIANILKLEENEKITSILSVDSYSDDRYIIMATAKGTVKKTVLSSFARQRTNGLKAITLVEGDYLIGTAITDGDQDVMLFSDGAKAVRFNESRIRSMGRTSMGVRGMKLPASNQVISLLLPKYDGCVLTVSQNGFGKITDLNDFPTKGRAGLGMIAMRASERNGQLVAAIQVFDGDEVMLISNGGIVVRTTISGVNKTSRATQGVRIIRLKSKEALIAVERIDGNILSVDEETKTTELEND